MGEGTEASTPLLFWTSIGYTSSEFSVLDVLQTYAPTSWKKLSARLHL